MKTNILPLLVTAVILAVGVVGGAHLAGDVPTESELEKADKMVEDPYEDQPWWSVGMMPVLLSSVLVLTVFYIVGAFLSWWTFLGVPVSMRP